MAAAVRDMVEEVAEHYPRRDPLMVHFRCTVRALPVVLLVLPTLGAPRSVRGDAIVRSQAMLASTIAEFYLEEGRVRAEFEIGLGDLPEFRNLLPDDIYEKLGNEPRAQRERLQEFFDRDLAIEVGGEPLAGRVLEIGPRTRVRRDDITGEVLPELEGAEPETVVFAVLEYKLPGRPTELVIRGPRGSASVGFVFYHREIPVNDFRYLTASQVLQIDWEDPWYTRFERRALLRRFAAPMSGFLYVEPYEVRKEIVLRPKELQAWVDLGLEGRDTIPVEIQDELTRAVAEFLREHQPVVIDGQRIEPELARANFLERTLKTSRVIEPPRELDAFSAVMGVIFVYPIESFPEKVTMEWDLWSERLDRIPAAAVDPAGALPTYLERDWRILEWENFLNIPVMPELAVLAPPPGPLARAAQLGRWLLGIAALASLVWWVVRARTGRAPNAAPAAATILLAVAAALTLWYGRQAALDDERSRELVSGLLHNVYRAFDFRHEEQIYDVLARSVSGELLSETYLETRRGLELASQGGARAKVKEIELARLETIPAEGGAFEADATWNVRGSVGHWGHVHERSNRYRATLQVAPVDGAWRLVGLDILEEERI